MKHFLKYLFLVLFLLPSTGKAQGFKLKRACNYSPDVVLYWSQLNDTCFNNGKVVVFARKETNRPFRKIDSLVGLSSEQYVHEDATITPANWSYFFRIYSTCSNDSLSSDTIDVDEEFVEFIELDSVSVDLNNHVQLGWGEGSAPDLMGYLVFYVDGTNNIRIDTLYGRNNTFYIDSIYGNPNKRAESYAVAGFDSCFNLGPIGAKHTSIYSTLEILDSCKGRVRINFSDYGGWNFSPDPTTYEIHASQNNGNFKKLWSGAGLTATFNLPDPTAEYTLKVGGKNSGANASTTSDYIQIKGVVPSTSDTPYIKYITVTEDGFLDVCWHIKPHQGIGGFTIFKGTSSSRLDSLIFIQADNNSTYQFTDKDVDTDSKSYYYKIAVNNKCLQHGNESKVSRSILLQQTERNSFTWNSYKFWPGGVKSYEVFRSNTLTDPPDYLLITSNNPGDTSFIEEEAIEEVGNSGICYYILATEGAGNPLGFEEESRSNIVCIVDSPIVFIPNAFVPLGENKVFAPKGLFIDYTESTMTIYTRWGERVKEINDLQKGWDGRDERGDAAPNGVYVYKITIVGINGIVEYYDGYINKL